MTAANPQFYTFECEGKRVSILTDTGYVSDKMIDYVKDSHTIVYESNHEEKCIIKWAVSMGYKTTYFIR